jgi:hypothetical protein
VLIETTPVVVTLLVVPDELGIVHTLFGHGHVPTLGGTGAQAEVEERISQEEATASLIILTYPELSLIDRVMFKRRL